MKITLEKLNAKNFRAVADYDMNGIKEEFCDAPLYSIAQAYVFGQSRVPLAIRDEEAGVIGFVMFRYDVPAGRTEIANFLIDRRFRRMGFGKAALKECAEYLRREGSTSVVYMDYDVNNHIAKEMYESMGFKEVRMDDFGERLMELPLYSETDGSI